MRRRNASASTVWMLTVGGVLAMVAIARADPPTTWDFVVETSGQDAFWTSPTRVSNTADRYYMGYEITLLKVTVKYLIFQFEVDVTNQIPPEQRTGQGFFDGPPPVAVFDGDVVYPLPPEPPGFSAHVKFGLTAEGYGRAEVTKVYLGTIKIVIPPYGEVEAQLKKVHIEGKITARPLWNGDLNCDGVTNNFDIDPFVLALTDPAGYAQQFPSCDRLLADCNGDAAVDNFDIDPFVKLLTP